MGDLSALEYLSSPVQYTNVVKILMSIERMYEGTSFEILVEPREPGAGMTYKYIIDEQIDADSRLIRKDSLHYNGSLKRRIERAKELQGRYKLLLIKSKVAFKNIKKHYKGRNYRLSLMKKTKWITAASEDFRFEPRLPEIRLNLDPLPVNRSRIWAPCAATSTFSYNMWEDDDSNGGLQIESQRESVNISEDEESYDGTDEETDLESTNLTEEDLLRQLNEEQLKRENAELHFDKDDDVDGNAVTCRTNPSKGKHRKFVVRIINLNKVL